MSAHASLYEADFYAWTQDQAARLRAMAARRINTELDLEHLAEEIESVGGSDRRELANRLEVVLVHLLKLAYCHYPEPRAGWERTVRAQRASLNRLLRQSPSLRRVAADMLPDIYADALGQARTETIDLTMGELPAVSPFTLDEVLDPACVPQAARRP